MQLITGSTYRRRDLHDEFGGQTQGGISTPAEHPLIFIFTGEEGEQYGYEDRFQEGVFLYTGEGQVGDMTMDRGNRAIRDHAQNGKTIHIFSSRGQKRSFVYYVGTATYIDHEWFVAPDRNGDPRRAIRFHLAVDTDEEGTVPESVQQELDEGPAPLWRMSLHRLRAEAEEDSQAGSAKEVRRREYERSAKVRVYALRRADGICEACGGEAPFETATGRPFLEVHHIRRLADEGPDRVRWVAAICPNCHRRIHHGRDGSSFNQRLSERIQALESN